LERARSPLVEEVSPKIISTAEAPRGCLSCHPRRPPGTGRLCGSAARRTPRHPSARKRRHDRQRRCCHRPVRARHHRMSAAARTAVDLAVLLPHLRGLHVDQVECGADDVAIDARSRSMEAACRSCGVCSSRVHSRYGRRLQDGALGGRPVVIHLIVRRFFCVNPDCLVVTFAEQPAGLSAADRRRTVPLLGFCWSRSDWRWRAGQGLAWRRCWASRCIGARCYGWFAPCPTRGPPPLPRCLASMISRCAVLSGAGEKPFSTYSTSA